MSRVSRAYRRAFTLVELLMVVTIIGILVGLIVPAVLYGMRQVKKQAIGIELQTLASAIEQYKNKYGSYPPDGTNGAYFFSHYKGIFRQIAASEFTAVAAACNAVNGAPAGAYMDPPEALVFALGGFSTDPLHPFTGPGGPLQAIPGGYQYNTDRNEPIYEFKEAQLTIDTSGGTAVSTDESLYSLGANDAMPVYRGPWGKQAPFVYFQSGSYSLPSGGGGLFFNVYGNPVMGYARPYKSDKLNTNVAATPANAEVYYKYMNDRGFQLVSAGLDDNFGGTATPSLFRFPTGERMDVSGLPSTAPVLLHDTRYNDGDVTHPQFDNVTNFADGPLENALP